MITLLYRVFWSLLYHFKDIRVGLKTLYPKFDWSYLEIRKREMSEKAKELAANQELFELIDQGEDVFGRQEQKQREEEEATQERNQIELKREADAFAARLLAPQPNLLMIGWYE
jgi:hypothetical protein